MNFDKSYIILSFNDENKKRELKEEVINNTQMEKLVHIDYKLKFGTHIEILCKNMGKKFHVLARVIKYMPTNHTQILNLIISHLSGCVIVEKLTK